MTPVTNSPPAVNPQPSVEAVSPSALPSFVENHSSITFAVAGPSGDSTGALDLANITAQIAAAQAAGGGTVQLKAGGVYTVNTPNSMNVTYWSGSGTHAIQYAIAIPSNVYLDLNGATIKAASGSIGALLVNANMMSTSTDHDLGWGNGTVDGNGNAYGTDTVTYGPVMWAFATRFRIKGRFRVINAANVAINPWGNTQGEYDTLIADTCTGQGISIGSTTYPEHAALIHRAVGINCTAWPGNTFNFPGNAFICSMDQGSEVETIINNNCAGGVKPQLGTQDTQIGKVCNYGGANGTTNCGLKLQGTGAGTPLRVNVGLVLSIGQQGSGLFMEQCVDCSVDRYIGEGNGIVTTNPDIWIGGTNDKIGLAKSVGAGGDGLLVRSYATGYQISTVDILNPGAAGIDVSGGQGEISSGRCVDNRGGSAVMTYGLVTTTSSATIRVPSMYTSGAITAPVALSGATLRTQAVSNTGGVWQGQVVLSSEVSYATGPNYGKVVKSGSFVAADVSSLSASCQPAYGVPWAQPLVLSAGITVKELGVNVTTAGDTGSTVQLCIWADDGTGHPGTLLYNPGSVAGDGATGYKSQTGLSFALAAGYYWVGAISQFSGTSTTPPKLEGTTGFVFPGVQGASGSGLSTATYGCYTGTSQGNAAPGNFTGAAPSGGANGGRVMVGAL